MHSFDRLSGRRSRVAERLLRAGSRPSQGGAGRLVAAAGNAGRRALLVRDDPLVRYELLGRTILLPLSHDLPYYRSRFPGYGEPVGRLAAALREKHGERLTVVDVGANVGDTAAIVRAFVDSPVLCVEGDPAFARLLEANARAIGDVEVERSLVGAASGSLNLRLATGAGTGRVEPSEEPSELRSLSEILRDHPRFAAAGLLKIDTDGYDAAVLAGSDEVLAGHHPVVHFEYDADLAARAGQDVDAALARLREHGYDRVLVHANEGDFVAAVEASDPALDDLLRYFSGRVRRRYCDLTLFHAGDRDVWATLSARERALVDPA